MYISGKRVKGHHDFRKKKKEESEKTGGQV
jgi:hypothetical protein